MIWWEKGEPTILNGIEPMLARISESCCSLIGLNKHRRKSLVVQGFRRLRQFFDNVQRNLAESLNRNGYPKISTVRADCAISDYVTKRTQQRSNFPNALPVD